MFLFLRFKDERAPIKIKAIKRPWRLRFQAGIFFDF